MNYENRTPGLGRVDKNVRDSDFIPITEFKELSQRVDEIVDKLSLTNSNNSAVSGLTQKIKEIQFHLEDALIYNDAGEIVGFNELIDESGASVPIKGPESFTTLLETLHDYYNEFVKYMGSDPTRDNWKIELEKYYSAAINEFRNKINSAFASSANISILETKNNIDMNYIQNNAVSLEKQNILRLNPDIMSYTRSLNIVPKTTNEPTVIFEVQEAEKKTLVLNLKVQNGFMYYDLDIILDKGKWFISKESLLNNDTLSAGQFYIDIYRYALSQTSDSYVFCLRTTYPDLSLHYNFEITSILAQRYNFDITNLDISSHTKYYTYNEIETLGIKPIYNKIYYTKTSESYVGTNGITVERDVYVPHEKLLEFEVGVTYYTRDVQFTLVKSYDLIGDESDGNIDKNNTLKTMKSQVVVEDIKYNGDLSLLHVSYDINETFDNFDGKISEKNDYLKKNNKLSPNNAIKLFTTTKDRKPTLAKTFKNIQLSDTPETVGAYGDVVFELTKLEPGKAISTNCFLNIGATNSINDKFVSDNVPIFNSTTDENDYVSVGPILYKKYIEKWRVMSNEINGNILAIADNFNGSNLIGYDLAINKYINENISFIDNIYVHVFEKNADDSGNKYYQVIIIPDNMVEGKINPKLKPGQLYYSFDINLTSVDNGISTTSMVYRSITSRETDEYLTSANLDLEECYGLLSNKTVTLAFGKTGIYHSFYGDVWYKDAPDVTNEPTKQISETSKIRIHNTGIFNNENSLAVFDSTIRTNCTRINYLCNPNNKYFQDNGNFYIFTDKTVTITENSKALTFNLCYISEDGFNWHVGICPTFTDIKFFNEDRIVFFDANNNHSAKIVGYYILKIGAGLVDLNLNDNFDKYNYSSFCAYFNANITDIKIRKPATKYLNKTLVTTDELPNDYPGCGALDVPKTDYEETISRFYEDYDPDEIAAAAAVVEYLPIYDVGYNNTSWFINCGEAFFFAKDDVDGTVNNIVDFSDTAQENVTSGMALPDEELYDLLPFYGSFHPEDRFDFTKYKIHASKYGDFIIYLTEDPGNFGNTGAKATNAKFPVFICNDGVIFKIPNVNLTSYFTSDENDPSQPDIYHNEPKQVHLFDQHCRGGSNHDITFLNLIGTESFMVDMLKPTIGTDGDIDERTELMNLIETPDEVITLRDNHGVTYYIRSNSTTFNEYCVNYGQTEMYGESNEDVSQYAARKIFNIPTTSSIDKANEYQGSLTILVGPNGLQVKKYTSAVEVFNPVTNLNGSTYEDVKAVECQRLQYHPFPRLLNNVDPSTRNYNEKTTYCVCVDGKMYFTKTDHTTPIPSTFAEAHVCDDKKLVTNIYNLNKRTYIGTNNRYYERNYGYDDTYVKTDFFADTYMLNTIKEFNNNILVFEDIRYRFNSVTDPFYILHQLHWDKNTNEYVDNPINIYFDGVDDTAFTPTINDLIISVNSCQGYVDENNDNEYVDNKYLFITGRPDLDEDGLWYAHYEPSASDITFYQSWDCDFGKINGFCESSEGLFIYGTNFDGGEDIWFSDKENGMPTFTPLLTVEKIDCVQVVDNDLYISAYDSTKPNARYSFNKETKNIEYVNAISLSDVASFNYIIEHSNGDKFIINGSGANNTANKGIFKVNKNIVTGDKMVINLTKISKAEDDAIFEHLFDGKIDNNSKVAYNTVSLTPTLDLISLSINDDTTDLITRVFAIDVANGNLTVIGDSSNNLQISQNINCDILKNISNLIAITNDDDENQKLIFEKNFYSIKIVDDEELDKLKIDEIYFDNKSKTFDIDYSDVPQKTISFLNNNTFAVNTTYITNETCLAMALGKNSLGVSIENKLAVYDKVNSIFKVSNLQYTATSSEASANVALNSDNYEILTILIGANTTSSNIYLLIRGKFPNVVYNRNTNQVTLDYNVSESNIIFKANINDFLSNNNEYFTLTVCEGYSFDGTNVEIAKEVMKEFVISNYMDSPNQDINFNVTPINEANPLIYVGSFVGLVYENTYTAVYFNYERNCFHFKTDMIYAGEIDESRNIDKGVPFTSSKIIDGEDYFIGRSCLIRDNKNHASFDSATDYVNIPGLNETIGLNLTNKKMIDILHNNDLLCKNSERMYGRHMQTQYGVFRYMPNNFVYDIKEDPQTSYFYNYMVAKHPDPNTDYTVFANMLTKPTMNIIQDVNGNTVDTGTARNNGYHAWFTPEGINKVTEIIAPEGGSIVKIYETLRGLFIEALVPDEHNSSVIHGGHKLYRMDKIPTDAYKSIISLSDKEYFTEVSIYGKYITQFEDTEYGLLANVAPLIEYRNDYIKKLVNESTDEQLNTLYNTAGTAVEEYEEIPKTYITLNPDGTRVSYSVQFNNAQYSGLCEKNNKYFDFDYINDDPDTLEPYILKYNGDDFVNILDSKHSYAIDYLSTIKSESTTGNYPKQLQETPSYKRLYGTRGEPDAISKFVLVGSRIIFINKFDRSTLESGIRGSVGKIGSYSKNSQSYLLETINLSNDNYLHMEYYWPNDNTIQQKMSGLNDALPISFDKDTRLCYPSKETNEYVLVGLSNPSAQSFIKSKISFNQSRLNFEINGNTFSISNGETGDFDSDGNIYRTLIAYPFIQKSVSNSKKYLTDLVKSMTNQNVPIDTNLKVIGNIIYKNHKINVNGLRIVSENGDSDNLEELVFNIDDEFRTEDDALLHEIKNGTLTIANDNYFKKCDLNVFYFKK